MGKACGTAACLMLWAQFFLLLTMEQTAEAASQVQCLNNYGFQGRRLDCQWHRNQALEGTLFYLNFSDTLGLSSDLICPLSASPGTPDHFDCSVHSEEGEFTENDEYKVVLHLSSLGENQTDVIFAKYKPRLHIQCDPPFDLQSKCGDNTCCVRWKRPKACGEVLEDWQWELAFKAVQDPWEQAQRKVFINSETWVHLEGFEFKSDRDYVARMRCKTPEENRHYGSHWSPWSSSVTWAAHPDCPQPLKNSRERPPIPLKFPPRQVTGSSLMLPSTSCSSLAPSCSCWRWPSPSSRGRAAAAGPAFPRRPPSSSLSTWLSTGISRAGQGWPRRRRRRRFLGSPSCSRPPAPGRGQPSDAHPRRAKSSPGRRWSPSGRPATTAPSAGRVKGRPPCPPTGPRPRRLPVPARDLCPARFPSAAKAEPRSRPRAAPAPPPLWEGRSGTAAGAGRRGRCGPSSLRLPSDGKRGVGKLNVSGRLFGHQCIASFYIDIKGIFHRFSFLQSDAPPFRKNVCGGGWGLVNRKVELL